jgi:hypothetical protein
MHNARHQPRQPKKREEERTGFPGVGWMTLLA